MDKSSEKVEIMGATSVKAKLKRMAYEIYETNFGKDSLVIVGIDKRGGSLANLLAEFLREISPLKIHVLGVTKLGKGKVEMKSDGLPEMLKGASIVVVDDVLYSGHTLFNTVSLVLGYHPAQVQTAILIDRGHRNVPVTHDFVGTLLVTSLKQHVSVEVLDDKSSAVAYLI